MPPPNISKHFFDLTKKGFIERKNGKRNGFREIKTNDLTAKFSLMKENVKTNGILFYRSGIVIIITSMRFAIRLLSHSYRAKLP